MKLHEEFKLYDTLWEEPGKILKEATAKKIVYVLTTFDNEEIIFNDFDEAVEAAEVGEFCMEAKRISAYYQEADGSYHKRVPNSARWTEEEGTISATNRIVEETNDGMCEVCHDKPYTVINAYDQQLCTDCDNKYCATEKGKLELFLSIAIGNNKASGYTPQEVYDAAMSYCKHRYDLPFVLQKSYYNTKPKHQ